MTTSSPLSGKGVIVTGANTGIGRVAAIEIAKLGATVILACRSLEKTKRVIDEIQKITDSDRVQFLALDLASFESIRRAAEMFLESDWPLHVLINNAGLAGHRGVTSDGFEITFGTNHLGHFLFTNLLLDKLKASAPSRIVNVSSKSHYRAKAIDFEAVKEHTRTVTGLGEYEVSKLANVLFTKELARRLEGTGVTTYALHPGVVASDAWRRVPWPVRGLMKRFMITVEDGAKTTVHCATSDAVKDETGLYYDECKERRPSKVASDEALAKRLWMQSAEWVGL